MRAVQRRARGLTGHYLGKAIGVDQNYGGARPGQVGRVQRKLETYGEVRGLVFGAFGEVSEGVHELVQIAAQSRLRAVGLLQGRVSDKRAGVVILSYASISIVEFNKRNLINMEGYKK